MLPETIDDAVALLLARYDTAQRIKQALQTPWGEINVPDISPHVQRVLTPGADDALGQALQGGLLGAGAGGLLGAGSAAFSDRRKSWLQRALTGALLGGVAGAGIPSGWKALQEARKLPPSVVAHQTELDKQQAGMNAQAQPGFQSHVTHGLTQPPDETAALMGGRAEANQGWSAAGAGTGLAARAGAEGALGYGAGRGADYLLRRARLNSQIPELVQNKAIGQRLPDAVATAVGAGATPTRAGDLAGSSAQPTPTQWRALRGQAMKTMPRGKFMPRVAGGAAAALPLIESLTGQQVDPVGWIQRMFRGPASAGQ